MPLPSAEDKLNIYAVPATISLVLLLIEIAYLAIRLPETKDWKNTRAPSESKVGDEVDKVALSVGERLSKLRAIGWLHGAFLLFFSGVSDASRFSFVFS